MSNLFTSIVDAADEGVGGEHLKFPPKNLSA
jgi:hypothetical protein